MLTSGFAKGLFARVSGPLRRTRKRKERRVCPSTPAQWPGPSPAMEASPSTSGDYGGAGPPLLLCHCTGGLGRLWDPVAARLREHWRVLAPDTRGHGASAQPTTQDQCRWEHSGKDLLAIIDALDLGAGLAVSGHSAGGAHVVYAALLRPGVFTRMALIDPITAPKTILDPAGGHLEAQARRRIGVFPSREDARARLAKKSPYEAWTASVQDAYFQHGFQETQDGHVRLCCSPQVEAWCYAEGGAADAFTRLGEIQTPTMLITGEHSKLRPLVQEQARHLPRAQIETVPGATHFVPQERPEDLAAVLRQWFLEAPGEGS